MLGGLISFIIDESQKKDEVKGDFSNQQILIRVFRQEDLISMENEYYLSFEPIRLRGISYWVGFTQNYILAALMRFIYDNFDAKFSSVKSWNLVYMR